MTGKELVEQQGKGRAAQHFAVLYAVPSMGQVPKGASFQFHLSS